MKSGFVAMIGRPNAGKSTLLNQLLERKIAIVSDKPQTTRNRITGVLTTDDAQIIYLDTPGMHKPKHKLGEFMMEVAENTLHEVDMIYYLVDATQDFGSGEQYILNQLEKVNTPIFLILNKVDLMEKETLFELILKWQSRGTFAEIFPLSALTGINVEKLVATTTTYLPEGPQYYPEDAVTDQPEQIVMAELIREKILLSTREEIPHSVAVVIELMQRRNNGTIYVGANIYVERDSQKGIIIGKKGALLQKIGKEARQDIEFLLGEKVYLDLWVKVKDDWRNRERALQSMGYDRRAEF